MPSQRRLGVTVSSNDTGTRKENGWNMVIPTQKSEVHKMQGIKVPWQRRIRATSSSTDRGTRQKKVKFGDSDTH